MMKCCGLPRGGRDWSLPVRRRGGSRRRRLTARASTVVAAAGFRQHAAASPPSKTARAVESVRLRATRAAHFHYSAAASRRRQRAVSQRHPSLPRRPRGVGTATAARLISKPAAPRPGCGRRRDSQQGHRGTPHGCGGTSRRRNMPPPTPPRLPPRCQSGDRRCLRFPPAAEATHRRADSAPRSHHAAAALDMRSGP